VNRSYRWATEKGGGLEHVELDCGDAGVTAEGVLIGPAGGRLFACSYALRCDERWQVRSLDVHVAGQGTVCLRADGAGNWTDADGTSLVIHAAPDDYRTDPSGNSGARIACGAFRAR